MDWERTGYIYDVQVNVVHQTDVDNTLGLLSGVQLEDMHVVENYNSDARVQASVSTLVKSNTSDGYIDNARLRILLMIPDRTWSEELVTGYVSDIKETKENGYTKRVYTIEGTIWGLLEHKIDSPIIIGRGTSMVKVWCNLLETLTKMQYEAGSAADYLFGNTFIYEAGSSLATILFEISNGYSRMDVDGHGRITLTPYISPASKTPTKLISFDDPKTLSLLPLEKVDSRYEAPGRAIVTATVSVTNNDGSSAQEIIVGSYDAPSTHDTSIEVRGWLRTRTDSFSGSNDIPSKSDLDAIARSNWEENQKNGAEWTCSSIFKDYHAGEVVNLITDVTCDESHPVNVVKAYIKSVRTNLVDMTQELSLKEV